MSKKTNKNKEHIIFHQTLHINSGESEIKTKNEKNTAQNSTQLKSTKLMPFCFA
jgi:hypothetical protein